MVGDTSSLEYRRMVWTEDVNLGVLNTQMDENHKTGELGEITR